MRIAGCLSLAAAALLLATGAGAADKAPDFKLPDLAGEVVQLSEYNAKNPVLIAFWATWCIPCPEELKHIQRFYDQHKESGFRVLAISVDGTKSVAGVKPFVEGRRFSFPVLLDTNNDVMRRYLVKAVPSVCLLKPGGEVAYHHVGYRPGDEVALGREIAKLVAETNAAANPAGTGAAGPAASAAGGESLPPSAPPSEGAAAEPDPSAGVGAEGAGASAEGAGSSAESAGTRDL